MLDVFRLGEREVVETVCLVIFPLISLKQDQVSNLNEKGVKAVVLGPGSSDTETKDALECITIQSPCVYKVGSLSSGF